MSRNRKFKTQCQSCVYQMNKGSRCYIMSNCFTCQNRDWNYRCNCGEEPFEGEETCLYYIKEEYSQNDKV